MQHMFLWPFYVYAYNFAQLVVLSLYQKYLEEGNTFKPVYYRILETGSAMTPAEILGLAGIDPRERLGIQPSVGSRRAGQIGTCRRQSAKRPMAYRRHWYGNAKGPQSPGGLRY